MLNADKRSVAATARGQRWGGARKSLTSALTAPTRAVSSDLEPRASHAAKTSCVGTEGPTAMGEFVWGN